MARLTGPAKKDYFSAIHALSAIGLSTLMVNHGRCSTAAQSHITLLGYFSRTAYSREDSDQQRGVLSYVSACLRGHGCASLPDRSCRPYGLHACRRTSLV